jgi:dolichol-phosphate mannosyltransferase
MKDIDIVLPVYNEEEVLPIFHAELNAVLLSLEPRYRFRLIYVVDRCRDRSFEVLRRIAAEQSNVTVLHMSRRFGHQMSLVAGMDQSRADALISMDCDLQHPPNLIPSLLQKFEEGYDIVQTIRDYGARTGWAKRATSRLFYRLQNLLSAIEIEDGAADFRLISRKVVAVFQGSIREQNQFLRGLFQWVGFQRTTLRFVSAERAAGGTKYRLLRLLTFSITGVTSFSKAPLRAAVVLGLVMSTASVIYGLWMIQVFFANGHVPAGYTSLITVILFIGGLQLTVLGIIGEYLGSVFDEVKRRPLYIIDEMVNSEPKTGCW